MSEQFKYAKLNLERTEQNLKTRKSEFIYKDTRGKVPENKTYSVYYLTSKTKLFFTNLYLRYNKLKLSKDKPLNILNK